MVARAIGPALRILGDLPDSDQVIHGDVSRGNILHGAVDGSGQSLWLVDPRGVTGDWQYDVAVAGWKCRYDHAELRVLCTASGADPDTVAAWFFVARTARV
jgi:streptomycin 6-kinase